MFAISIVIGIVIIVLGLIGVVMEKKHKQWK